jgi:glycosyltransferase involved in cell wall biosynthesis
VTTTSTTAAAGTSAATLTTAGRLRLGFACNWDPDPRLTWSHTPWNLRSALREHADVLDVGVQLPAAGRMLLKAAFARRRNGRWTSAWKHSALWASLGGRAVARAVRHAELDAVLQVGDLAVVERPFFVLQDLSVDLLLRHYDEAAGGVPHLEALDLDLLRRRRQRQLEVYERATGVLAMSRFLARSLVMDTGLPAAKVHVIYPGATAAAGGHPPPAPRDHAPSRRRLLFVGKDFLTKGGDVVVRALSVLRSGWDPAVTLTVAGPSVWPLPGPVPDGVEFLGRVPVAEVTRMYDRHDLLVMPSRLEGFGIVFVEALARGLPCVGRDAFAMPEIIEPGRNGGLVAGDDPEELARVVAGVLDDDRLYAACADDAAAVARRFTWQRAAAEVVAAVGTALR